MEVLLPPLENPHITPQVPDSCAEPHPADLDDQVSSCSTEPDIPPLLQLQINEPKEPMKIEPDHYYDNSIPVFKPTMEQFQNFDNFIKAIDKWGNQFGIVKVIPPQKWTDNLPDISNRLEKVSIKSPIEQHFSGSSGIFRQDNFELKRTWSVDDWLRVSMSDGHRPPYINMPKSPAKSRKARGLKKKADQTENHQMNAEPSSTDASFNSKIAEPEFKEDNTSTVIIESNADSRIEVENSSECHAKLSIDNIESVQQSDLTKPEVNSHGPTSIHVSNVTTQQQPSPPESTLPSPEHKDGEFLASEADIEVDDQKPDSTLKKKSTPSRPKVSRKGGSLDLSTLVPTSPFLDKRYSIRLSPKEYKDLERTYWRTLTFNAPMYGADMLGTLWSDETPSTWNTNNLDGLLSKMGVKLSGVNVPYLYFGMWKATFAWHVEDMDLYSINYLHFGAPKQWYAIPPSQSSKFERFAQGIFPSDHKHCSEFLRHKTFHFSPSMLANHNIKINRMVQEVGEFVITFPHGYHAGYNLGFNCAESVNFASPTWIDIGKQAKSCTCVNDSVKIDVFLWERVWKGETTWDEIYASWMASQETPEQVTPNDEAAASNEETGPKDNAGVGSEMSKESSAKVPKKPKVSKPRKRKEADSPAALSKKSKKVKPNTSAVKVKLNLKSCSLCPSKSQDDMLPTSTGQWVHRICAQYIPETWVQTFQGRQEVFGLQFVPKDRWRLKCGLCKVKTGACIQCSKGKCTRAFHVTCARDAKLFVKRVDPTPEFLASLKNSTETITETPQQKSTANRIEVEAESENKMDVNVVTLGDSEQINSGQNEKPDEIHTEIRKEDLLGGSSNGSKEPASGSKSSRIEEEMAPVNLEEEAAVILPSDTALTISQPKSSSEVQKTSAAEPTPSVVAPVIPTSSPSTQVNSDTELVILEEPVVIDPYVTYEVYCQTHDPNKLLEKLKAKEKEIEELNKQMVEGRTIWVVSKDGTLTSRSGTIVSSSKEKKSCKVDFKDGRPPRTILWRDVHFEPPVPPPSRLPSSLPIRLSAPNQDSTKGNGLLFHPNAYGKSIQNPYMNPHLMMPMFSQNHPPSSNSKPPQSQINSSRPLLYPTAPYAMPSSYLPTSLAPPYNPALGYTGYYPGFNTNPYGYNGVGGMYPYPIQYMKSANPPPQGGHPNTDGTNLPRIAPKPLTNMTSTMPESTKHSVNHVPTDTGAMKSTSVSNSSTDADTSKNTTASSGTVQTSTSSHASHSTSAAFVPSQSHSSSSSHTLNSVKTSKSVTKPVAVPEYGFTFPNYDVPTLRNLPQQQSTQPSSTSDKSTNPTPTSVPPPHIPIPPIPTSGSTQLPYPMPPSMYYYPYMSMLPYHQQQEAIERLGIGKRQRNTIVGRDARKPKKPRTQEPPNPTTSSSSDVHISPPVTESNIIDTCQNGAEGSGNTESSVQSIEPNQQVSHVERPIIIDNDYDYEGQMGRGKRARNRTGQNAYGNDAFEFYSP